MADKKTDEAAKKLQLQRRAKGECERCGKKMGREHWTHIKDLKTQEKICVACGAKGDK